MDKGGMCEKRRSEDSEESDEEMAGFWLISLCKLKKCMPTFKRSDRIKYLTFTLRPDSSCTLSLMNFLR